MTAARIRVGASFLLAFVAASVVLRLVAPPNPDHAWHPTLTVKWDHLRETDEHYDVVFVGDSRAFRALDPIVIGDELERLGCPASVFNLGAVAMTKFEYDRTMEILATTPGGTPDVVVTVDALTLLVGLRQDFSVRHRGHLDARSAPDYLTYVDSMPDEFGMSPLHVADLAAAYAVNQIPTGAVHQQIFSQPSQLDEAELVRSHRGFQPWEDFYDEAGPEGMANLRATLEPELTNGGWERRWAEEEPGDDELQKWIGTLRAHSDEVPAAAQSVHMFVPSYYDEGTTSAVSRAWRDAEPDIPIINLVDRSLVGDYTDPDYFIDFWHLSERGATEVSKAAAAELCPILDPGKG